MKNRLFILFILSIIVCSVKAAEIPRLEKRGNTTELIVDGQPFTMLAGELHNSSTGSKHYMQPIWHRMAEMNLNTVIAPVTWELFEPAEGQFDYNLLDCMIEGARRENLKLVILWFGTWKNGISTYVPSWVKTDQKRFPLVYNKEGDTTNTLSALGRQTMQADTRAFAKMMEHIKAVDEKENTVIMIQIENEIGTLDAISSFVGGKNKMMRDFSKEANRRFQENVPMELMDHLIANKKNLHPAIKEAWEKNGAKKAGTWEQVFGKGEESVSGEWNCVYPYLTEEIFNSWNYATYVESLAKAGKEIYPLPMYVNAWIKQPSGSAPGLYPCGGPQPHVFDIWKAGAPHVDLFAPDIYANDVYEWTCDAFHTDGNALFIPEVSPASTNVCRAFYTFGKHAALGFSPFGIDGGAISNNLSEGDTSWQQAYGLLKHLTPYIYKYGGTDRMTGLLIDSNKKTDQQEMGDYKVTLSQMSTEYSMALMGIESTDNVPVAKENGVMVVQVADNEFIVAGGLNGITVNFTKSSKSKSNKKHVGLISVDEITFDNEGNELTHRLNGDETSFGHVCIYQNSVKAFRVRLYEY